MFFNLSHLPWFTVPEKNAKIKFREKYEYCIFTLLAENSRLHDFQRLIIQTANSFTECKLIFHLIIAPGASSLSSRTKLYMYETPLSRLFLHDSLIPHSTIIRQPTYRI